MSIRVGFDGRALVSPAPGVRRYTRELFGAMAALHEVDVVAVGAPAAAQVPAPIGRAHGGLSLPGNAGWMLSGLPRAARAARLDLFHAPAYTSPLGGPRPLVVTIHDVSYARHPEWYPYRRDVLRRAFYRWSARTADRIITVSDFSRGEISAAFDIPPSRIDVVPLAASPVFTGAERRACPDGAFFLHVGDLHPRRNLETVVRALAHLGADRRELPPVRLVLVGSDLGAGTAVAALADRLGVAVQRLERIEEAQLLELYGTAIALVYPSRYEGFGLPLVEAMAAGTPVIAARAASIPEVTGDAAVLVDPLDEAGWAEAMASAFEPEQQAKLQASGRRRARDFSWRHTAEMTVHAYRRALDSR